MSAPWYRKPLCWAGACNTFSQCSICHKRVGFVSRAALRQYADAEAAQNEPMPDTDLCCCEWCGDECPPAKMATAELCEECIHVADLEEDNPA